MNISEATPPGSAWKQGLKDALPLLGAYIPIAISFGLISIQSGFGVLETILISVFIYAGASQFLFVAMVASGSPLWLVVIMTLLINARHVLYAPNITAYLGTDKRWIPLMHCLTDQIFALSLTILPKLAPQDRMAWYTSAALLAWFSWIAGTAIGAIAGDELTQRWPLINDVLPFALPALFLVLVAPRCTNLVWTAALACAAVLALVVKLLGYPNVAIPLAAIAGALVFHAMKPRLPSDDAQPTEAKP
ncbi:AzlC family ABC transporter permease [Oceanobacter kriegii]|uniref:AzlC family ABC transporter permease n=1 Tax=Oceanobacter kriegii TaxID=64972 RepID=UPI00041D2FC4|nr:AzlC family ABC transporter permease [Oceanobacter kriegii]